MPRTGENIGAWHFLQISLCNNGWKGRLILALTANRDKTALRRRKTISMHQQAGCPIVRAADESSNQWMIICFVEIEDLTNFLASFWLRTIYNWGSFQEITSIMCLQHLPRFSRDLFPFSRLFTSGQSHRGTEDRIRSFCIRGLLLALSNLGQALSAAQYQKGTLYIKNLNYFSTMQRQRSHTQLLMRVIFMIQFYILKSSSHISQTSILHNNL